MMIKINYFNSALGAVVYDLTDKIVFDNGYAKYSADGMRYAVPTDRIVSIESVED